MPTATDYTLTASELASVRTLLSFEGSFGPSKNLNNTLIESYFKGLNALSSAYPHLSNQLFVAWSQRLFELLTKGDTLAEMYVVWRYIAFLVSQNGGQYEPPGKNIRAQDIFGTWRNYWHVFIGNRCGWYVPWPAEYGSNVIDTDVLTIPLAPAAWQKKVCGVKNLWGDTPPSTTIDIGTQVKKADTYVTFEKSVLSDWADFPKVTNTTAPIWEDQNAAVSTMLSADNLGAVDYFFMLHMLVAIGTGTPKGQTLAEKIVTASASSTEYPNDTFGNQLIYLTLMYLANPTGNFGWNNSQLLSFITDMEDIIKSQDQASQALRTSMATHKKILNSDSSYPLQDMYNPSIGFNTRMSDTLNALEQARQGLAS